MSAGLQVLVDGEWRTVDAASLTGEPATVIQTGDTAPVSHAQARLITSSEVFDTDTYIPSRLQVHNLFNTGRPLVDSVAQVKGRGNLTWEQIKKPYKVKFTSAASPFGFPASVNWALMADFLDYTGMNSTVLYEIARRATGRWTPRSTYVELLMNDGYRGLYRLSETCDVQVGRVNIRKMKDGDVSGLALTGPYLLEASNGGDFLTARGSPILYDTPKVASVPAQVAYIKGALDAYETRLVAGDESFLPYTDVDSLADWIIAQEISANEDGDWWRSCKFYKEQDTADGPGKFVFWPVWDFDLAFGGATQGFRCVQVRHEGAWPRWSALAYANSVTVRAAVRARWDASWKDAATNIGAFIDDTYTEMGPALARDRALWKPGDAAYPASTRSTQLKTWLAARIAWLDANL